MNKNGPHRPIGSSTMRKCGLVVIGVTWLEEGVTGAPFEVSDAQAMLSMALSSYCLWVKM